MWSALADKETPGATEGKEPFSDTAKGKDAPTNTAKGKDVPTNTAKGKDAPTNTAKGKEPLTDTDIMQAVECMKSVCRIESKWYVCSYHSLCAYCMLACVLTVC